MRQDVALDDIVKERCSEKRKTKQEDVSINIECRLLIRLFRINFIYVWSCLMFCVCVCVNLLSIMMVYTQFRRKKTRKFIMMYWLIAVSDLLDVCWPCHTWFERGENNNVQPRILRIYFQIILMNILFFLLFFVNDVLFVIFSNRIRIKTCYHQSLGNSIQLNLARKFCLYLSSIAIG